MLARYHKSNEHLPKLDKDDAAKSTPLLNSSLTYTKRQAHPEFSQSSYERLRTLEGKLSRVDYTFDAPKSKYGFMTEVDRTYAIQKIYYLHEQKAYRPEALFTAATIFD